MKAFFAIAIVALVAVAFTDARAVRDLKSTLISKGNELIKRANEAISKLQHKPLEAGLIKVEEAVVKRLVAELESSTDQNRITRIEHELARAEEKLNHTLSRVNTPPAKRDLKSNLITKGNALVKRAEEALAKIAKQPHHSAEATIIKVEEAVVKRLIAELESTQDQSRVSRIEHELARAEEKLNHSLSRIN